MGQPRDNHGTTAGQPRANHGTTAGQPGGQPWDTDLSIDQLRYQFINLAIYVSVDLTMTSLTSFL
eukprot:1030923-Pyramimonas_sp.AAC.1